jgi:hypothetical protein
MRHVRDGVHGLVVWAVAVALGTSLATLSIAAAVTTLSLSSAVKGGADIAKSGASSVSSSVAYPSAVGRLFKIEGSVMLRS